MQVSFASTARLALCVALVATIACGQSPQLLIHTRGGGDVKVPVELALTPVDQQRGLMFRRDLAENAGMLFVFSEDGEHSFWMKNTPLPLDMIFIDKEAKIVGIVENTIPFSTASRGVGVPSRYVLEVHAGFAARHGIRSGDTVSLPELKR